MIDVIWSKILKHEGEVFTQIKGKKFTYRISGNSIIPSTTNRIISSSQIEKALKLEPLEGTTKIQHLQGPSYIYAILMDYRIRERY